MLSFSDVQIQQLLFIYHNSFNLKINVNLIINVKSNYKRKSNYKCKFKVFMYDLLLLFYL